MVMKMAIAKLPILLLLEMARLLSYQTKFQNSLEALKSSTLMAGKTGITPWIHANLKILCTESSF